MKKSRKFVAVIVLIAYCLTFAPSNTAFASNAREVSVITGFKSLPAEECIIKISERDKLTLQQIMDIMPKSLDVYLDGSLNFNSIPVSWFCVSDDYGQSKYYYYQFSPRWDETQYALAESIDLLTEAPYIAIFITEEEASLLSVTNTNNETAVYNYLVNTMGFNMAATCGIMANLESESYGFNPKDLEGLYESPLGYTDDSYTAAVDSGKYANFVHDCAGYGICQWTYYTRKQGLLNYARKKGVSIGNLQMQLEFMEVELKSGEYASVLNYLRTVENSAEGAYNAASYFCKNFENPANVDNQAVVRGNLAKNTYWPEYGKNSADNSIVRCNVSEKAVDCNATKGSLPAKASPVYVGETYRFNLQVSEDKKLSKAELYIKPVGGEFGKKFTYTPTGNATYFRYCDYKYAFENKTGKVEYYWKLFHTDGAKEELDKKTVSVTRPGTPGNVAATVKDTKTIKLTWDKVADAETYTIKWRVASSDPDNWQYEKGVTGTSYTFDTLEAGHRYTFRVIAYRGKSESEESKKEVVVTFNNAPKITRISDASLKLEWDAPQNAKSYAIWRRKHDGSYKEIVSGVTEREYTDVGLKAGTRYYYYVVAACATDNSTYPDCVSKEAAYSTYISAPKLTAQGQNSIKLEWKQNNSDATYSDFEIYRKAADKGSFEKIKSLKWSATSYIDTGLTDGTAYEYYIKAVGEKGFVPSLSAKATTDAKPTYYLDVNGYLDEQNNGKLTNYGTMDVYIDGKSVADNADDYYRQWPSGTEYEIKDIRPTGEHAFVGVKSGALSGTINSATTIVLEFASVYVVRYDANGGTEAPPSQTKQFGKDLTLSAQIPLRNGYAFAGWSDAPDGDVLYQPGSVCKENASLTLYAIWDSNSAQLVIGSQSASPGGQVTVPVSLKSNPGVAGFSFAIEYDAEKLEYLGAADGNFPGIADNVSAEGNQLGFAYSSASDANLSGETIVKLTFQAKSGAKGTAKLRIVMDENFGDSFRAFNSETQTIAPVNVDTQDGEITIADLIPGDVDSSGRVDNDDLILLTRYRARWKVTINMDAADVDGSGKVDNDDLILLTRYRARWKVALLPGKVSIR